MSRKQPSAAATRKTNRTELERMVQALNSANFEMHCKRDGKFCVSDIKKAILGFLELYQSTFPADTYRKVRIFTSQFHGNKRVLSGEIPALIHAMKTIDTTRKLTGEQAKQRFISMRQVMFTYLMNRNFDTSGMVFAFFDRMMALTTGQIYEGGALKLYRDMATQDHRDNQLSGEEHPLMAGEYGDSSKHRDQHVSEWIARVIPSNRYEAFSLRRFHQLLHNYRTGTTQGGLNALLELVATRPLHLLATRQSKAKPQTEIELQQHTSSSATTSPRH